MLLDKCSRTEKMTLTPIDAHWEVSATLSRGAELCHRCTQDGSVIDMFVPVDTGNARTTFSLASSGDTIILYCMAEPGSSGNSEVRHISAITRVAGSLIPLILIMVTNPALPGDCRTIQSRRLVDTLTMKTMGQCHT